MVSSSLNNLVTVVVPAYNRAHLIGRAITSVLSQTYRYFEVIVVDDGSTDNLAEAVKSFFDERLHYIRHDKNRGGSAARNTGIASAKGEYIAFLDSDDEWFPDKLEKQIEIFQKSSNEVGIVYTGWRWILEMNGKIIQDKVPTQGGNIHQLLLETDCIGSMSTPLIRTDAIRRIGGFDENLPARQDWDLWIRLSEKCTIQFIPEVLVNYYLREESISASNRNKIIGTEYVLNKYKHEFDKSSRLLVSHLQLLTILYLLEGEVRKARSYNLQSVRLGKDFKTFWKASVHYLISFLSRSLIKKYFALMRLIDKDFYWINPAAGL